MRARISPMSLVPNGCVTAARSVAVVACRWKAVASSLP
jgi:hypothetical protein